MRDFYQIEIRDRDLPSTHRYSINYSKSCVIVETLEDTVNIFKKFKY